MSPRTRCGIEDQRIFTLQWRKRFSPERREADLPRPSSLQPDWTNAGCTDHLDDPKAMPQTRPAFVQSWSESRPVVVGYVGTSVEAEAATFEAARLGPPMEVGLYLMRSGCSNRSGGSFSMLTGWTHHTQQHSGAHSAYDELTL